MREKHILNTHTAPVEKVRYCEHLGFFASSSSDNSIAIYEAKPPFNVVQTIKLPANPRSFSFCKSRLFVAAYDHNVYVYVWNMEIFKFYRKIEQVAESELKSIAAQESRFFTTGRDRKVYLYSFTRDEETCELAEKTHEQDVKCVDYNGERAVSCGYDNTICFYRQDDMEELKMVAKIESEIAPDCVGAISFVQNCTLWCCLLIDDHLSVSGGADGCLRVYRDETQIGCYRIHDGDLYDISQLEERGSRILASCGADGCVSLMRIDSSGAVSFDRRLIYVGNGELNSCCLIPGYIVCGGDDGAVIVIDN